MIYLAAADFYPRPTGFFMFVAALYGAVRAGMTYQNENEVDVINGVRIPQRVGVVKPQRISEYQWNMMEACGFLLVLVFAFFESGGIWQALFIMTFLAGCAKVSQMLCTLSGQLHLERRLSKERELAYKASIAPSPTIKNESATPTKRLQDD